MFQPDVEDLYEHLKRVAMNQINVTSREKDYRSGRVQLTHNAGMDDQLEEVPHHVFFYRKYDKDHYRAFCGGSIITEKRVLTVSHPFVTNRKKQRFPYSSINVVAASLQTYIIKSDKDDMQWRNIDKIYTQRFFRAPSYDLAVVEIDEDWKFNEHVSKIPYASQNSDYDGVCNAVGLRPRSSWSLNKGLYLEPQKLIIRSACEQTLLRTCRLFYCTIYESKGRLDETDGSGLVCHGTGDPAETDPKVGLLVGVTALVNGKLPTLHHRVGLFNKWVTDGSCIILSLNILLVLSFSLLFLQ